MTDLLYEERVVPGASGYAPTDALVTAWQSGQVARLWSLGARPVSVQLTKTLGGGIWKTRERFMLDNPMPMLTALESIGVRHPSSFADCFHQVAPDAPRLPYTLNGLFSWWHGGPWSQARRTGAFRGSWYRYDLTSAYRWAGSIGLPDPTTYRVVRGPRGTRDGLWIIELEEHRPDLPPVFAEAGNIAVASTEEIDRYNLRCTVRRGVTWSRMMPDGYVDDTLAKLPCAKQAGRAYWGRWIARDPLVCQTPNATWHLHNRHAHFVWGWLIVGRVRLRVWEVAQEAAHVYVDEVVVPHELPTGDVPGSWHLKEYYPQGVDVRRTGWYGPRGASDTMRTGHVRQH